jgi:hypothetical protein
VEESMGFLKNIAAKLIGKKIAKGLALQEGNMEEKKPWYKSKGVLTGIVTVLVGAYETSRVVLAPHLGVALPDIPPFVYTLLGAIGIYSRAVAEKTIG